MDTPEVHAPHPRRHRRKGAGEGLPRWLELSIAVTALVTSISSIAIAVQHGRIMEKLVEANSVPYLEGGFSNRTPEGGKVVSLDLLNRGVGPAHEESMRVTVDGHYVRSVRDLIVASLGPQGSRTYQLLEPTLAANSVPKRFIAAGQSQQVFRLPRPAENAQLWDLLARQQSRWNVEFCYCSVFDECWTVHGRLNDDRPVKECRRDEATEFMP